MKKLLKWTALTLTLAMVLTGCGQQSKGDASAAVSNGAEGTEDLQTLRVAVMTNGFDQYTVLVGQWQGIFEKNGLKLEVTEYGRGINTIDAVANGTADVGNMANYAAVNRFGNTFHDTNLIIFSELSGGGLKTGGLYVAPKYADNLAALDGSEGFLTILATVSDYQNSVVMEYLGLDESKQNIIAADSLQTELALAQKGDASAVYTTGSSAKKYEEYGWVLAVPSEELDMIDGAFFITSKEYNAEHADVLAKFLLSIQESFDFMQEDLQRSGDYLESQIGINAADFVANWSSITSRIGFSEEGAAHLDEMKDWALEHGSFEEDFNIRDFINTDAAEIAVPDKVTVVK